MGATQPPHHGGTRYVRPGTTLKRITGLLNLWRERIRARQLAQIAQAPTHRGLSREMSRFFAQALAADGIRLRLWDATVCIRGNDGRVCGLDTMSGERLPAELIVVGIGVIPNVELAAEAGLCVENGVKTDQALLTSDLAISAVGDCACFPNPSTGVPTRLESVQNATGFLTKEQS
jgi:NAD(P)H-nitrite reductase large subunit